MISFLKYWFYNQDKSLSTLDSRRVTILNFCCLIMMVDVLFFFIKRYLQDTLSYKIGVAYIVFVTCFLIVYLLQRNKWYYISKILFIVFFIGTVFYLSNVLFKNIHSEYNYIAIPILALLFFDKKWIHYLMLLLSMFLFFIPYYITKVHSVEYFIPTEKVFLFLILFIVVNFFKSLNSNNEKKLEKAYAELEEKKQGELAHLQLKSLKAQMNPHFMFNVMNSIQALILKENKHEAYEYLTKFASLIRENLNMSEKSFVYFEEELSLLKKYLELEKLRFQNNFEYKISGIENITDIKIPSMIIQPFIENAIKHGLLHKTDGVKKVTIEFYQEEVLKCIVVDNGIGIQKSKEINTLNNKEASFSTKAIHDRLGLLKGYYKTDIGFTYEKVKQGTKVIIKIPYVNLCEE
ncbi:sensor histidine kinase [Tenacibaculum sp. 190524A02b]|uniref:sensor histidine kinase n=1 Tax=Tenacibaculum vairaonense TaxID=3137860 RepID=UPI0031FA5E0A